MVTVTLTDPADPDAQHCIRSYFAELARRFEGGFEMTTITPAEEDSLRPPAGLFLLARLEGAPIGCGGLRFHGHHAAEIKRMWVSESARGLGLGRRLLGELEQEAIRHGAPAVRLDTNSALVEAISLYRSAGYLEIAPFTTEPYAHLWFEKRLADSVGESGNE